jgi:hypothetical protein
MRKGFKCALLFILATSTFLTACGNNKNGNNVSSDDHLTTNPSGEQFVPSDKSNNENSEGSTLKNGGSDTVEE